MRLTSLLVRACGFVAMACLAILLGGPGRAEGNFFYQVTMTNNAPLTTMPGPATDLEMTFYGNITGAFVVLGGSGAGNATIMTGSYDNVAGTTMITMNWTLPSGLPSGTGIQFDLISDSSFVAYKSGEWTYPNNEPPIPTDQTRDQIIVGPILNAPEPSSIVLTSIPIAVGLIVSWRGRRRR
jgi:hypothetical protein